MYRYYRMVTRQYLTILNRQHFNPISYRPIKGVLLISNSPTDTNLPNIKESSLIKGESIHCVVIVHCLL